METYIDEYSAYLVVERGSSPLTISAYEKDLQEYCEYLQKKRGIDALEQVTREDIVAYESVLLKRFAVSSIERKISAIKGFHPEFKSRPTKPHPLFMGLVHAAVERKNEASA